MSKSNETKAVSQLVCLLLCILLVQTAFAEGNATTEITITGNATNENSTIGNATNENSTIGNASVNSISPSSYYTYICAGTSTQITASFTNGGNETLFLAPKVVAMSNGINSTNETWITIFPTNATVAPGSVQDFNVGINVPWDAESGDYQCQIAFTDDLVPGTAQYVNSMQLNFYVYAQPKIELQTSYIYDTVEAGKEYEYKVKIRNVAPRDITINPTFQIYNSGYQNGFGNDTVEFSTPSTIKTGEITDLTIKVHVPENATNACYGHIYMNVDGKVNDFSSPGIDLSFYVGQQLPPYVKAFYSPTNGPIKIEISADKNNQYNRFRTSPKDKGPSFELVLTHNSSPVNLTFVNSVEKGGASFTNWYYPTWGGNAYQNYNGHYTANYTAPGAIGDWELTILPKSTNSFQYSITIGDDNSAVTGDVNSENTTTGNTSTGNVPDENIPTGSVTNEIVADFSASPTTEKAPLTVKFKDESTGSPTSWFWSFGDKSTSTDQNPEHKYNKAGKYTVSLTVRNSDVSNTKTIFNYITAEKK